MESRRKLFAAPAKPITSEERDALITSIPQIKAQIQDILERSIGLPNDQYVLRRLSSYYAMLSDIHRECGNEASMIKYGCRAIAARAHINPMFVIKTDYREIAQQYERLAGNMTDKSFAAIFQFGCDYFNGNNNVSFSKFDAIVKASNQLPDPQCKRNAALLKLMKLIEVSLIDKVCPDNNFKSELASNYYRIRFKVLKIEQEDLRDKFIDEACKDALKIIDDAAYEITMQAIDCAQEEANDLANDDQEVEVYPVTNAGARIRMFETTHDFKADVGLVQHHHQLMKK